MQNKLVYVPSNDSLTFNESNKNNLLIPTW